MGTKNQSLNTVECHFYIRAKEINGRQCDVIIKIEIQTCVLKKITQLYKWKGFFKWKFKLQVCKYSRILLKIIIIQFNQSVSYYVNYIMSS